MHCLAFCRKYGLPFLLLFAFLQPFQNSLAETSDSLTIVQLKVSLQRARDSIQKLQLKKDTLNPAQPCIACTKTITDTTQLRLVYAPFILLLVFLIIFIIWINKSNFTLEDALSVAPSAQQIQAVAQANMALAAQQGAGGAAQQGADNPPPQQQPLPQPQPQRSTSRLLAFITGVAAILVAICMVSYYAYAMFAGCGNAAQFDALWKVLAGLGIGIVPYGINLFNGNPKEQPVK